MKSILPFILGLFLGALILTFLPKEPKIITKEIVKIQVKRDTVKKEIVKYKTLRQNLSTVRDQRLEDFQALPDSAAQEFVDSALVGTSVGEVIIDRDYWKSYSEYSDSIISLKDSVISLDSLEISKKDSLILLKDKEIRKQKRKALGIGIIGIITTILGFSL